MNPYDIGKSWDQWKQKLQELFDTAKNPKSIDGTSSGKSSYAWLQSEMQKYQARARNEQRDPTFTQVMVIGAELYPRLVEMLNSYCENVGKLLMKQLNNPESLLEFIKVEWVAYENIGKWCGTIFSYLDTVFVPYCLSGGPREGVQHLKMIMISCWKAHAFRPFKEQMFHAVIDLIQKDRNGIQVDDSLIKTCQELLVSMGLKQIVLNARDHKLVETNSLAIYQELVDQLFDETDSFYTIKATDFQSKTNMLDYMKKCNEWLLDEENRCKRFLHPESRNSLQNLMVKVLVERYHKSMEQEFTTYLEQASAEGGSLEGITILYKLFNLLAPTSEIETTSTERGNVFAQCYIEFESFAIKHATDSIDACAETAVKDPKIYMDALLKEYRILHNQVKVAFKNDPYFLEKLQKVARYFVNKNKVCELASSSGKSAELMARYVDGILRKSNAVTEEELEVTLNDIVEVLNYLEEKDVFMEFYRKNLCDRLLQEAADETRETSMFGKLKSLCGHSYCSKLQKMFNDMKTNEDSNEEFKRYLKDRPSDVPIGANNQPISFTVQVLTAGAWPLQTPSSGFVLPEQLSKCTELYIKFYSKKSIGKRLQWLYQFAKGDVCVAPKYMDKPYTFESNTFQIAIILLFNEQSVLTLQQIQEALKLDAVLLDRALKQLLKTKILMSNPTAQQDTKIEPNWKFKINQKFTNQKLRLNINIKLKLVREEDTKKNYEDIEADRNWEAQAAIVRVMKTRKRSAHNDLMMEVIGQLQRRFNPSPALIKKCIDILIEKEYLERDPDDRKFYRYLA